MNEENQNEDELARALVATLIVFMLIEIMDREIMRGRAL